MNLGALRHIERDIDDHVLLPADHLALAHLGQDRAVPSARMSRTTFGETLTDGINDSLQSDQANRPVTLSCSAQSPSPSG
jgi:hypothetical protein